MKNKTFSTSNTQPHRNSWESKTWWVTTMRYMCCYLVLSLSFVDVLQAQVTWQNDSLASGQNGIVQAGFVNGDIAAAVFDLPCNLFPIQINNVQVFWRSVSSQTTQVFTHIRVYGNGGPNPGSPIYSGEGAVMTDGYMNEFPTSNLGWTLNQGPFTVGVEYLNGLSGPVNAANGHITTDTDGCQTGKNLIYHAAGAQWIEPCSVGMSGDFVIRINFDSMSTACYGDSNCDTHVDRSDVGAFQACLSGDGVTATPECQLFDCDGDNDVDVTDYSAIAGCLSGPDATCNPGCATCVGGPSGNSPVTQPGTLIDKIAGSFQSIDLTGLPFGELVNTSPGDEGFTAQGFQLSQQTIVIGIVLIIAATIIGVCYAPNCRTNKAVQFRTQSNTPDTDELARIREALLWLGQIGDSESDAALAWYTAKGIFVPGAPSVVLINHWDDREGFAAEYTLGIIFIHVDFVTGPLYDIEALGLLLFAEWQHADRPSLSEDEIETRFKNFRNSNGLKNVHPEIQHGPMEGAGG